MVRLLWICCLVLLAARAALAVMVSTDVDRGHVRPGESVVVTYTVDGQVPEPDFSPLEKDFEILNRGESRNITISGGDASVEIAWKLVLRPRHGGELTLPALRIGDGLSEARTLTVAGSEPAAAGGDKVHIEYGVDDPTPYVNQQLVLTVKVRTTGSIDAMSVSSPAVVQGDARIDRLGGPRQYETVRDSRRYQVHEQRYTLVPGAAGMLRLSPVDISGRIDGAPVTARSAPLEIQVRRALAAGTGDDDDRGLAADDLFVEVGVDEPAPYVQQQVLYTVRVFRAVAIENATLSKPAVSGGDAVVERFGDDRRYQATRDGRRYAVTERRFAVFPQTSGRLAIEPVRLSASVPLPASGGDAGFWARPQTQAVRVASVSQALEVKPPPAGAPEPWLPARAVALEEDWPARDSVEVGTPITRRITLSAEGLMASQLPALEVPLPAGVKSYPERPSRETAGGERSVNGRLAQTMAIIPAEAGTLVLPALELDWWNTVLDRRETVRLPAHTLKVTGIPQAPAGPQDPPADPPGEAWPERIGWWLSLGLGLLWLATLVLWRRDRLRVASARRAPGGPSPALSRRQALVQLREACRASDPGAARDALLVWGRACWPQAPPRSLGALGRMVDEPSARQIAVLQQALYAPAADGWQGDGLYAAIKASEPETAKDDAGRYALEPLFQQ